MLSKCHGLVQDQLQEAAGSIKQLQNQIVRMGNQLSTKDSIIASEKSKGDTILLRSYQKHNKLAAKHDKLARTVAKLDNQVLCSKKDASHARAKLKDKRSKYQYLMQTVLQHRAFHMWRHKQRLRELQGAVDEANHALQNSQRRLSDAHQHITKLKFEKQELKRSIRETLQLVQKQAGEYHALEEENYRLSKASETLRSLTNTADYALASLLQS